MKKYIFFALILCANISFSQTSEKEIQEVNILGRKKLKQERKEFQRHSQSTETLSEEELNRNNAAQIEHSLGTIAGVQVDKRTNIGGQRIVIRGYGNDQKFNNWGIKSYLNGIPITNADGITILEDLDFSLVNQVEVVKGPASTLYGGGIGGTVRFYIRPSTEKGTAISEKLTLGSFNHFQSQTKAEAISDNASVLLNYSHIESDGYRPTGNSLKNNYTFLGSFKLNNKQILSVYTSHSNSYEGVAGQISYADYDAGIDNGNTAYMRKNAGNKFISTRAAVSHIWNLKENFSNTTSVFFSNLDVKRVAAGAYENSENPNYGFRSVFNLKNKISENVSNQAEFGIEYLSSQSLLSNYRFTGSITNPLEIVQDMKKNSYFKYQNNNQSVFAIDKITYQPWDLTLVLGISGNKMSYQRTDLYAQYNNYGQDLSFDKEFSTFFTPHIALQKLWKNQIFNLSYSEGYNAPTSTTAAISGVTSNVVNDHLLPERAKMWDFSVHGLLAKTKLDYQISVFNINILDKLTQTKSGTTTFWENTGNQRNTGLEMSLGYVHTSEKFLKKIMPFVNWSYYDFRYRNFLDATKTINYIHHQVVGVPRNKISLGLDFDTKIGLYLVNTYNYLGEVYTDFDNTNLVKGFGLLNSKLGFKKTFGKLDADVFLAANNITKQINYTFLFLGNNINDSDVNSNYNGVKTDVNPGYHKAWFQYGINLKYSF